MHEFVSFPIVGGVGIVLLYKLGVWVGGGGHGSGLYVSGKFGKTEVPFSTSGKFGNKSNNW